MFMFRELVLSGSKHVQMLFSVVVSLGECPERSWYIFNANGPHQRRHSVCVDP